MFTGGVNLKTVIAELRASGMTDGEIAIEVGCSPAAISMWANGRRAARNGNYFLKLFRLHQQKLLGQPHAGGNAREAA